MKRFSLLLFIFIISFLTACSLKNNDNTAVTIDSANLSAFEQNLLDLIGEYTSVVELQINDNDAEIIEVSIDQYKNGEKQEEVMLFTSYLDDTDLSKPIRVLISKRTNHKDIEWLASIISDEGTASMESKTPLEKEYTGSAFGMANMPTSIHLGEKKVIGTVALTDSDSVHIRSDIESDEDLKEATDYEEVFIINLTVK